MQPKIDYFFISASPFAYLGHSTFHRISARNKAVIHYRPMKMLEVWAVSGSVPVAHRSLMRQRYRAIDLQRIAEMRGLPLNILPRFMPTDPALADRTTIALVQGGADPAGFLLRVHRGLWANEENIADRQTLSGYLEAEGHDAEAVLYVAESEASEAIYDVNTRAAIAAGAIGAPTYVLNGEPFWGQDRLEYLDRALETRRAPFGAV